MMRKGYYLKDNGVCRCAVFILFVLFLPAALASFNIYEPVSDEIAFNTSGVERMRIDSDGNIGIGTTGPGDLLHVDDGDIRISNGSLQLENDAKDNSVYIKNLGGAGVDLMGFGRTTSAEDMVIDNTGNVGIGTTEPSDRLDLGNNNGNITGVADITLSDSTDLQNYITGPANRDLFIRTGGVNGATDRIGFLVDTNTTGGVENYSEVLSIIPAGNVGIGDTSPDFLLEVDGTAGKPGGGDWSDSSDIRLKNVISNLSGSLDLLTSFQPIKYEWKNPEQHFDGDSIHAGLSAQAVEEIFPKWISEYTPEGNDALLIPEGEQAKALFYPSDFNAYVIGAFKDINSIISLTTATTSSPSIYIGSDGNVGIGTTTPTNILTIGQGMGNPIADGWNVYSSAAYKTEISYLEEQDYDEILGEIGGLEIATYRWKKDFDRSGEANEAASSSDKMMGVIAEQAPKRVLSKDGKSVSLYDYATFALAGVKALKQEVERLEVEIYQATGKLENICDSNGALSTCSSDARLKENIEPLEGAVSYLSDFRPVKFNFIGENQTSLGLVAQDVNRTHPELLVENPNGYYTYEDPGFKYLLIRAVQEQQEEIEIQRKKIQDLQKTNSKLLAELCTKDSYSWC